MNGLRQQRLPLFITADYFYIHQSKDALTDPHI
jgi:hypothetical protein